MALQDEAEPTLMLLGQQVVRKRQPDVGSSTKRLRQCRDNCVNLSQVVMLTRLTRLAPDFAEAWNKRATVLYLRGRLEESVIDVKRTLKLEPRHFGALSGLGLIYLAVGQPEIALKALDAALAIHPQMPGPREKAEQLRDDLKGRKL